MARIRTETWEAAPYEETPARLQFLVFVETGEIVQITYGALAMLLKSADMTLIDSTPTEPE